MDFVLTLHSHLPYVLNHGRWPHGSDWLCEAAIDTYLPLLERLNELAAEGTAAPVTIGVTPVLASQLASPVFVHELEAYFEQRLTSCDEAPVSLRSTGDSGLLHLVDYWRSRLLRLREVFHRLDRNIPGALRRLEAADRLEIISSAATHGFLPLLARDESIRLQLAVGRGEHRRLFGRSPVGCWLPECAYRSRGEWNPMPGAPYSGIRRGIEEHLADAGYQYFFTDAHMAQAGLPVGASGELLAPGHEFSHERHDLVPSRGPHSPYRPYRVAPVRSTGTVTAFVRDPLSSLQVWSRHQGYPGDEWYLEFHKIRWPGGLKLWRVSGPGTDLGEKQPYDPAQAMDRVSAHAAHFAWLLSEISRDPAAGRGGCVVAPFDTELFGHWWYEGPDFLAAVFRELRQRPALHPSTAGQYLAASPARSSLRLGQGSWGANGDFSMWLNEATAWTWRRLWPLEQAFWDAAPAGLANPAARPVLAQAARELLLAQSSDWQFIISTGAVADYAERRFLQHCEDAERLITALTAPDGSGLEEGRNRGEALARRDDLFPDILASVEQALSGSRALA